MTFLPVERRLRWAYAGHPPALALDAVAGTLRRHRGDALSELVAALSSQALRFASRDLDDDLCLLAARMS